MQASGFYITNIRNEIIGNAAKWEARQRFALAYPSWAIGSP
jgi:hypothetical protein